MVTLLEQLSASHVREAPSVTMEPPLASARVLTENTWLILEAVSVRLATSQLMDLQAIVMAMLIVSVSSTRLAQLVR